MALLERSRKRLHRVETEMHRRWASGFTCLTLAMVGIPLAIRLKTSDTMTTFGIVFLPTLVGLLPGLCIDSGHGKGWANRGLRRMDRQWSVCRYQRLDDA